MVVAKDADDAGAKRIIASALSRGIKIFYRDKEYLDREVSGKHQGFIAEITDFKYCELDDILQYAKQKEEPPFIVILDGVEDPHNLGSVLRVCECAGVHGVIIPRHRSVSVNETVIKVSSGAAAHIKVAKVNSLNYAVDCLKKAGYWLYALEADGQSIYQTDLSGNIAFVIGGEDSGVKRLTREKCDFTVSLPLYGKVNSLNASVALGIAAYEAVRRR